jgi:hypothetical protein
MNFIDMDEGVYPDSPQNREKVIQSSLTNMLAHFDMLGNKDVADGISAADLPKSTVGILNKLRRIAASNPNGEPPSPEGAKEWFDAFEETMSEFANDEKLKEGWANFAEVYTAIRAMHNNGEGTKNGKCVLLPESSTLETVDVIQLSRSTAKSKYVTLDGISVKKGKGGASALTSKIDKAVMTGDDGGTKKKRILEMSASHTEIYEDGVDHKKYRNGQKKSAIAAGVDPKWVEQVENEATSTNPKSKVNVALKTIMDRRKKSAPTPKKKGKPTELEQAEMKSFLKEEEEQKEIIKQRLQSYYINTYLTHMAYNQSVDAQDFGNDSVKSQPTDKGGAKLRDERKIEVDSSDGITTLAYARPVFDVGFSDDGRSSNPGSGRLTNKNKEDRPQTTGTEKGNYYSL